MEAIPAADLAAFGKPTEPHIVCPFRLRCFFFVPANLFPFLFQGCVLHISVLHALVLLSTALDLVSSGEPMITSHLAIETKMFLRACRGHKA